MSSLKNVKAPFERGLAARTMGPGHEETKVAAVASTKKPMHRVAALELGTLNDSFEFAVDDRMYADIIRGPSKIVVDALKGLNAYVFGRVYKRTSSYTFIGSHGNDIASTALVDADLLSKSSVQTSDVLESSGYFMEDAEANTLYWDAPTHKLLEKTRRAFPWVLFVGKTIMGDVGANILVHRTSRGRVDSVVVDNGVYHASTDSDSEDEHDGAYKASRAV